jgi:GGDEF domain-containing protein
MTMKLTILAEPATSECECLPLAAQGHRQEAQGQSEDYLPATPVTPELGAYLQAELAACFPRSTPISVLLLHVSQLDHVHISPKSAVLHKRHRFHAPESFLEQVLANVCRSIRGDDRAIVHGGAGAAIIFPDVDQEGVFSITERVYHSINLLQPETVIPPLARETDIFIGMASYPAPANSFEALLGQVSRVVHRLTLRPAVTAQLRSHKRELANAADGTGQDVAHTGSLRSRRDSAPGKLSPAAKNAGIPFMQLPARLPTRLRHLIPYHLARELRCAPVGRDHNRLTVAMACPTDSMALDLLKTATSMVIYPVACEAEALDALLANEW